MPGARPQSGMTEIPLASASLVQLLLLQHDLGVAAEVGEVEPASTAALAIGTL